MPSVFHLLQDENGGTLCANAVGAQRNNYGSKPSKTQNKTPEAEKRFGGNRHPQFLPPFNVTMRVVSSATGKKNNDRPYCRRDLSKSQAKAEVNGTSPLRPSTNNSRGPVTPHHIAPYTGKQYTNCRSV